MNKNINLVEILKNAPTGTKLWSPICGECVLSSINIELTRPISVKRVGDIGYYTTGITTFLSDGRYADYPNGECMLFPSKENRDWSTFKAPLKHKHFEPGQKVLVKIYDGESDDRTIWALSIYSCCVPEDNRCHYTVSGMWYIDSEIIPYEGNENKLGKPVE